MLEFGIKRENEERRDGGAGVVFDPQSQKYAVGKGANGHLRLFSGGFNPDENKEEGSLREVREESGLYDFEYVEKIDEVICHFHNPLKNVNRIAYASCFLIVLKSINLIPTQLEDHEKFALAWASPAEIIKNWESINEERDYDHWIYFLRKSVNRAIELGYDKSNSYYK